MAHEHGEEFPREATRELVGAMQRAERRRGWLQDLALAAGLALFALGLPTERLLGRPVRSHEPLHFLAAALCFALGWLVLARAARRNGWDSGPALRASSIAALAPVVVLAATTPGPAAAGWLGACLVLTALVSDTATAALRALAWLAASLLHPWNFWLWPAWLLREQRGRAWCLGAGLVAGVGVLCHVPHGPRDLLAGLDGGPGPCVAWWTLWVAGLGGAALALLALRRAPPLWLAAFALLPLGPLSLSGTIAYDLPWIWLAPLGWLGALELEQRGRRTGLLLAGSLVLAAAALVWIRATDPERAWRERAEELLEPRDVVLTLSREHHYLIGTRHGMRAWMLPARWRPGDASRWEAELSETRAAGRRVVLDEDSLGPAAERLCDRETFEWAVAAANLRLRTR